MYVANRRHIAVQSNASLRFLGIFASEFSERRRLSGAVEALCLFTHPVIWHVVSYKLYPTHADIEVGMLEALQSLNLCALSLNDDESIQVAFIFFCVRLYSWLNIFEKFGICESVGIVVFP